MTAPRFSAHEIDRLKKQAKQISKERNLSHSHALDLIAKEHGYGNWSQFGKGSPEKPPTKRAMRKWFDANHASAVECSPYDGREGGYLYPTVDVWEALENAFPDADPDQLDKLARELDAEDVYVASSFIADINADREHEAFAMREEATAWVPPLKEGRYKSTEIIGIDSHWKYIKVACVRYRLHPYITDNEPGQLIFRCPVCNKVHLHGAGGIKFGAGDGTRVPHCHDPSLGNFQFDLVEVAEASRAGHLPKTMLKHLKTPKP